jgi:ABC-2 type transport system permease protein
MILQAFGFYTYNSWKNSILTRFRRLRQPKYLVGAIVGVLYFYFVVFARRSGNFRGATAVWAPSADTALMIQTCAATFLFILFLIKWLFPAERAALVFTEAEIAFLFPAPVSRKALINFKLLRTQLLILIGAIMFTIFSRWGGGNGVMRVVGWWIVLSTMSLHSLASSFAVARFTERGLSTWKRRTAVLTFIVLGIATIGWFTYQTAPPPPQINDASDLSGLQQYYIDVSNSGAIYYLLLPFRLLLAPFFATDWLTFFTALLPAIVLWLLHYWWVISANVAFEEASIELSRKTAEKVAAIRSGNWGVKKPTKAKRSPFRLKPEGSPALAIFWKNLISSGQIFSRRFWFFVLWIVFVVAMVSRGQFGWAFAISLCAIMFVAISIFLGPQLVRLDFRQDLPLTDILKLYPMRGWQVVLGEILAPAFLLACAQWLLIAVFLVVSPDSIGKDHFPFGMKLGVCLAAALALPFVDLIVILIQNTAVLLLPAWFQFDKSTPRGIETMGQQLILMFGQILALLLCLIPASAIFALVVFVGHYALPLEVCLVLGAIAAAAVACAEIALAVRLLGGVFERFDLSAELSST